MTDVTSCQFFPSGVVILTGGSDMQLKIWSAEDGSCPVTMKGHRGGKERVTFRCSRFYVHNFARLILLQESNDYIYFEPSMPHLVTHTCQFSQILSRKLNMAVTRW